MLVDGLHFVDILVLYERRLLDNTSYGKLHIVLRQAQRLSLWFRVTRPPITFISYPSVISSLPPSSQVSESHLPAESPLHLFLHFLPVLKRTARLHFHGFTNALANDPLPPHIQVRGGEGRGGEGRGGEGR